MVSLCRQVLPPPLRMKLEVVVPDNPVIVANGLEKTTASERRQGNSCSTFRRVTLTVFVVSTLDLSQGSADLMTQQPVLLRVLCLIGPCSDNFGVFVLLHEFTRGSRLVMSSALLLKQDSAGF
jgi:hypothetical protein